MTFFSDIQRDEVIRIAELLIGAGRAEMIPGALRQGMTLEDVRWQGREFAAGCGKVYTSGAAARRTRERRRRAVRRAVRTIAMRATRSRRKWPISLPPPTRYTHPRRSFPNGVTRHQRVMNDSGVGSAMLQKGGQKIGWR